MAPDLCKWAVLAQLARERFPEDSDVAGALGLAATRVAEGERAEEAVMAAAVEAEAERMRVHAAVAEAAARGVAALVEAEREAAARDIATVGSTAGPFLRPYIAAADLIAEADDAAMAEVEVVAAAQPQEAEDDNLDGLFDDEEVAPATSDEQAVLLASIDDDAPRVERPWADVVTKDDDVAEE
jgi:hypothetical protein